MPFIGKRASVRLDPESYERLRKKVLRRDGWRCQVCGAMSNLEVHHRSSEAIPAMTQKRT